MLNRTFARLAPDGPSFHGSALNIQRSALPQPSPTLYPVKQ
jgi:hypothetical protein